MKGKWLGCMTALAVTVAASAAVGYRAAERQQSQPAAQAQQPVLAQEQSSQGEEPSSPASQGRYRVGAYQGRLAVFSGDGQLPEMVFDVYLHHLPDVDRQRLSEGIWVEDYESLVRLVEDYVS